MDSLPYGSWPSPISAESLVAGKVRIGDLVADGADIWWSESRPDEGGRVALVRWRDGVITEMTLRGADVRTSVHEYGGSAWWVADEVLFYVDFSDQRLRMRTIDGAETFLTPEPPEPRSLRYADFRPVPGRRELVAVRERHGEGRPPNAPENDIVVVPLDGSHDVRSLVSGADFYAAPRPSRDGSRLAWVQWSHPNMPWDGTELWVAEIDRDQLSAPRTLAGGPSEAVAQPEWAPNGELYFLSDRTGRSGVYRVVDDGPAVVEVGGDFDVGLPMWVLGQSRYAIDDEGILVAAMRRPTADAILFDRSGHVHSGWTEVTSVRALADGRTAYIGSTPRLDPVAVIHDGSPVLASTPHVHGVPDSYLPDPELITFPTSHDAEAHALFYRPVNPAVRGPLGQRPPLLVLVHGGPTSSASRSLDLGLRYWTSRGWAVVDVDYRGSVGYGRRYMRSLDGEWGVTDVDDCVAAARYLTERGDVDGRRLAIRGSSAGGFTTLAALVFHDAFAAGASRYGIADLTALAADTHKFESRYMDTIVGPYPEAKDVYADRSPINHIERLDAPVILLQGSDDRVVPPNQAEMMVEALGARGVPHAYLLFDGEGHGFRSAASRIAALEAEYSFFAQIFEFEPADEIPTVDIR